MVIGMITGSYPPDACGVGDYTHTLVQKLGEAGVRVEVLTRPSWRVVDAGDILSRARRAGVEILHIQYPTVGYGWQLGPQWLSLVRPGLVTLHEASQAHFMRKAALLPFLMRSQHIVFTTQAERAYVNRFFPWVEPRSSVIPIGTNLPGREVDRRSGTSDGPVQVVYFGLIRPRKGLELFLEVAERATMAGVHARFGVIGRVQRRHQAYYEWLRERTSGIVSVQWYLDLTAKDVEELLATRVVGYLPFPDGATERRGSLLALLSMGVPTVTTRGSSTPRELEAAVLCAQTADDAILRISGLLRDDTQYRQWARAGIAYSRRYDWESIARQHIQLYHKFAACVGRF